MTLTRSDLNKVNGQLSELSPERVRSVENEWPPLIEALSEEMVNGTDPKSAKVQELAAKWYELLGLFTGGDADVKSRLSSEYHAGDHRHRAQGSVPSAELCHYVALAMA